MQKAVSLWVLVARTDLPYLAQSIPHQIRSCNYPFAERVLAIDTAPLVGHKSTRYGKGSLMDLKQACQALIDADVVDRIVEVDYNSNLVDKIYIKYFGAEQAQLMRGHTHNWKGSTVYASLYCIEAAASDYYLHFDADMLLYQSPDFDWISSAIEKIEQVPEIAVIRPLCGPPLPKGKSCKNYPAEKKDERGFYFHKGFSMRAYLVDRRRFAQLSPIPLSWKYVPLWSRWLPKLLQRLGTKIERRLRGDRNWPINGAIDSFEPMTSQRLENTKYLRADLTDPRSWTIHPKHHTPELIQALPKIIQLIEQGKYPPQQAGKYDLDLAAWLQWSTFQEIEQD